MSGEKSLSETNEINNSQPGLPAGSVVMPSTTKDRNVSLWVLLLR